MGISARAFSILINESPTNTQNYIGKRNSMPGADYLEKLLNHFEDVNPIWLTTGKGEPFLTESEDQSSTTSINVKKNKGNVTGTNHGDLTQNIGSSPQSSWKVSDPRGTVAAMEALIEQLKSQLADKERTIQILLNQSTK